MKKEEKIEIKKVKILIKETKKGIKNGIEQITALKKELKHYENILLGSK